MVALTAGSSNGTELLTHRIRSGDERAVAELFARRRRRLRRMIRLRLDRRLHGRVDPEAVLDEAHRDVVAQAGDYVRDPRTSPFVWFREVTGRRLAAVHRHHLGPLAALAGQEVSLVQGALPHVSTLSLAAMLLGQPTSLSHAVQRASRQLQLEAALNRMDRLDREVLTLRHFEGLNNQETAEALGLSAAEASRGYLRALMRLKEEMPGLMGPLGS